jgi:hypothetical protein
MRGSSIPIGRSDVPARRAKPLLTKWRGVPSSGSTQRGKTGAGGDNLSDRDSPPARPLPSALKSRAWRARASDANLDLQIPRSPASLPVSFEDCIDELGFLSFYMR